MATSAKAAILAFLLAFAGAATAGHPNDPPGPEPEPPAAPNSTSTAAADASAAARARAAAQAVGGDQTLSVVSQYEESANAAVLVPNNNTENCLRVFGLAFSTRDGSAVLGIPWRSGPCDLEAAADDAFAQGRHALGWSFKCKMPALARAHGGEAKCLQVVGAYFEADQLRAEAAVQAERIRHLEAQLRQRFTTEQADARCERQAEACLVK